MHVGCSGWWGGVGAGAHGREPIGMGHVGGWAGGVGGVGGEVLGVSYGEECEYLGRVYCYTDS